METQDIVMVLLETEHGNIEVAVDRAHAPITAANFLHYVDAGFYDGGRFHRTVTPTNQPNDTIRIEVIQGGVNPARKDENNPPIPLERTTITGLAHRDGTISMARFAPDSAVSDIFICIGGRISRPPRLRRDAQSRWAGLRHVRWGRRGHGCRPCYPGATRRGAEPHPADHHHPRPAHRPAVGFAPPCGGELCAWYVAVWSVRQPIMRRRAGRYAVVRSGERSEEARWRRQR